MTHRPMPATKPYPESVGAVALLQRYRSQILTLIFACLAVWLVFTWALTIRGIVRYYSPFPSWDYWRVIYDAYFHKTLGFGIYLKPHNEHRIIFPEIIYQLDLLLLHGRLVLPLACTFLCYLATYLVFGFVLRRDHRLGMAECAFAWILAGLIMGWQGSAVVVGDPFLLQWTLSTLCVFLSLLSLTRNTFVPAIIAALIATYSSSNCLLLWPVLIWQAWLLRLTRRKIIILAIAGLLAIGAYFIDYHAAGKLNVLNAVLHPAHALGFLATYISMPFGHSKSDAFAICLGTINILLVIVLFLHAVRKRMLHSETLIFLFSIYLFMLLSALSITIGRIDLTPGEAGAQASRYWVLQLIGWADFVVLCTYFAARSKFPPAGKLFTYTVLLAFIGYHTVRLQSTLPYDGDQYANRQLAALSFESGLLDSVAAGRIFPAPSFVFRLIPFMRSEHLSVYASSNFALLGKAANTAAQLTNEAHVGAVISTLPVQGGIEIIGWAEPDRDGSEPIVFLNEKRTIVGFGGRLPAAFPFDLRSLTTPVNEAWVGFANLSYGAQNVSPFFLSRGRLQRVGDPIPVDTTLQPFAEETGALLTNVRWYPDPDWTINGTITYANRMGNLPRGTIYGTWNKDDRKTGNIRSSAFPAPATACLILPVAHGPFVHGLSVDVANADTGQPIMSIPLQNGDLGWQFWRLKLNGSAAHIRIIAQDKGSSWGEWLAIAQPSACASLEATGPS